MSALREKYPRCFGPVDASDPFAMDMEAIARADRTRIVRRPRPSLPETVIRWIAYRLMLVRLAWERGVTDALIEDNERGSRARI